MLFLDVLENTDIRISLKNVNNFSPELGREFKQILKSLDSSFGKWGYSFLVSGSLALCLRAKNFIEFKPMSDIDSYLIVDLNSKDVSEIGDTSFINIKGAVKNLIRGYDASKIYTDNSYLKHLFSIKVISRQTFLDNLSVEKILVNEYRESSLVKVKPRDVFYGFSSALEVPYVETREKEGYKLIWENHIAQNNDFILTDYHSVMLFGGFIRDGLNISIERKRFIGRCRSYIERNIVRKDFDKKQRHLLTYFYKRQPEATGQLFG